MLVSERSCTLIPNLALVINDAFSKEVVDISEIIIGFSIPSFHHSYNAACFVAQGYKWPSNDSLENHSMKTSTRYMEKLD